MLWSEPELRAALVVAATGTWVFSSSGEAVPGDADADAGTVAADDDAAADAELRLRALGALEALAHGGGGTPTMMMPRDTAPATSGDGGGGDGDRGGDRGADEPAALVDAADETCRFIWADLQVRGRPPLLHPHLARPPFSRRRSQRAVASSRDASHAFVRDASFAMSRARVRTIA
jgi:hypothetical protein